MKVLCDHLKQFLAFSLNIIQVKVISGHPVKKVNPPPKQNRDMALQYMLLGQLYAKNTKNGPKTLFENQTRSKNKIRKTKRKWANLVVFNMFYVITQPFLKTST